MHEEERISKYLIERTTPNADIVREHPRQGGFPADRVREVLSVIGPTTAEDPQPSRQIPVPA